MNVLSIQSWVAYGHVGNASAIFPLQRLGAEVWAIYTVQFSNHTGYGAGPDRCSLAKRCGSWWTGLRLAAYLGRCDAVLSGYMGDSGIGEAILDALARVRAANPGAFYCCDPVIGDEGRGVYVRAGIPELLRDRALPLADLATPNAFELTHLTGLPCLTLDQAKAAVARLQQRMRPSGPRAVCYQPPHRSNAARLDRSPRGRSGTVPPYADASLPVAVNGAGDALAASSCSTGFAPERLMRRWRLPVLRSSGCCGAPPRLGRVSW